MASHEAEKDELIDLATEALGVKLLPSQRQWLGAVLSGERVIWSRGRRVCWTTVRSVAEHLTRPGQPTPEATP